MAKKKASPVRISKTAPPPADNTAWMLPAALLLGLVVRVAYLIFSHQSPFFEPLLLDPGYYHHWALRIAGGEISPPSVFYGLPLFPYVLALLYKLTGASLWATKIFQILLGLVTIFFVYRTGEKLGSRLAGGIAAMLTAVYGPLFFHEAVLIPENLAVPLYAASFYYACGFFEKPTAKKGAVLGVLFGLAALTKAGIMLFIPVFAVMLILRQKKAKAPLMPVWACLAVFVLTLAPVTAHNFFRGKDTVLLTSHAGFNFYVGNNPLSEGTFVSIPGTGSSVESQIAGSRAIAERELGRPLKPSEVSKYWSDKAMDFIRQNPGRFLELCVKKFILFFDSREISDVNDYSFEKEFNPMLRFPWPGFALLGPLFILGLMLPLRRSRLAGLVYAWIGAYLVGLITFFINARYRLPMLAIFLPLAGLAVVELIETVKAARWGRLGAALAILAAAAGFTQLHPVGADVSLRYVNAGDAYFEKHGYNEAIDYYKKALAEDPESAKANLAMGMVLAKLGKADEAKDYFLKSIVTNPSSQAYNNLGLWYYDHQDVDAAEKAFNKAMELDPSSSQPYNNLGMIYGNAGRLDDAIRMLRKSVEVNPSSTKAYVNLGLALYKEGQRQEGVECWRKVLEIEPGNADARKLLSMVGAD